MKRTLKYFFSFCGLCLAYTSLAQETNPIRGKSEVKTDAVATTKLTDTTKAVSGNDSIALIQKDRYGLRVGADLYRLSRGFYDKNYTGIELVADYRLTKTYYAAAELGSENKTTTDDRLDFTTKGSYLKVGFDYNAYKNWLDMENIISIGLRAGLSRFNHQLHNYRIYNPNPYWQEAPTKTSGEQYNDLTAGWIEVVAGLKVKVYNNIFVGFSLRMNTLIFDKSPTSNFENLYIPGFNRTYAGNFGAGFNYTVSYFVPLYKKNRKPASVGN